MAQGPFCHASLFKPLFPRPLLWQCETFGAKRLELPKARLAAGQGANAGKPQIGAQHRNWLGRLGSSRDQAEPYQNLDTNNQANWQHSKQTAWKGVFKTGTVHQIWRFVIQRMENASAALYESAPRSLNVSFRQVQLTVKAGSLLLLLLIAKSIASLIWNILVICIIGYALLWILPERQTGELFDKFRGNGSSSGDGTTQGPRDDLIDVWFETPANTTKSSSPYK